MGLPLEPITATRTGVPETPVWGVAPKHDLHALIHHRPNGEVDVESYGKLGSEPRAWCNTVNVAQGAHEHLDSKPRTLQVSDAIHFKRANCDDNGGGPGRNGHPAAPHTSRRDICVAVYETKLLAMNR
jgi:hypothetical protein